jgi:hypothetical protein
VCERAAAPHHDRPVFATERTAATTVRTRLLLAQLRGLSLRRFLQGASEQAPHRRHANLFHLSQIDVQSRPLLAPLLSNDDFSPAFGQFLNPPKIF